MGIGELIARFGTAGQVLQSAADGQLRAAATRLLAAGDRPSLPARVIEGVERISMGWTERLARLDQLGLWTLTPLETDYPERLRDLDPPPAVIYGWGDPTALTGRRSVALVGTRRPTAAGRQLATRVAARLVECRAAVVSGLAIGIDGAGHAATVERGGRTVAVIGAGHEQPGPRAHARLRERILAGGGAIVSEHYPDVGATRGTYPRRNRIIAALADATVVVEAPARSGALITARHALELGRPVFVAPGRVGDWAVAGSLALLRETPARPLVGLDELAVDLGYLEENGAAGDRVERPGRSSALALLGATERVVAERLCRGPAGLDVLVADTGLAPAVVSGAVTLLQMRGWVQPLGPAFLVAGPLAG